MTSRKSQLAARERERQEALAKLERLKHQGNQSYTHRGGFFTQMARLNWFTGRPQSDDVDGQNATDAATILAKGLRAANTLFKAALVLTFLVALTIAIISHRDSMEDAERTPLSAKEKQK